MFEFIRKKPIDFFKDIYFDDIQSIYTEKKQKQKVSKQLTEERESSSPKETPKKLQVPVPKISLKMDSKPISRPDIRPETGMGPTEEVKEENHVLSTQSKIIGSSLNIMTEEMSKMMQGVMERMKSHNLEIEEEKVAERYWNYIYKSAVYLQQILSDITTVHESALFFSKQESKNIPSNNN